MRLIFLGPQGVGKGTQAELLAARLNVPQLSTGDMLRAEVKTGSELGKRLDGILQRGELVPDTVMLELIGQRMSRPDARSGFILDGFPRTLGQAEGLDALLDGASKPIDAAVLFQAPRSDLLKRMLNRMTCPVCGNVYNLKTRPPKTGTLDLPTCEKDGAVLVRRSDDTPEAINRRLDLYEEQTAPLAEFYRRRGVLRKVDGIGSIAEVQGHLLQALGAPASA